MRRAHFFMTTLAVKYSIVARALSAGSHHRPRLRNSCARARLTGTRVLSLSSASRLPRAVPLEGAKVVEVDGVRAIHLGKLPRIRAGDEEHLHRDGGGPARESFPKPEAFVAMPMIMNALVSPGSGSRRCRGCHGLNSTSNETCQIAAGRESDQK